MAGLSGKHLSRIALRSFFLQSSWNFERLQNLGFLFVIAPALRALYQGEELLEACRRHLDYFNTHPFLASSVIGTTVHLEELRANAEEESIGAVDFKKMVMAPYAAMGDALFWGGLRSLAACLALFFAVKQSLWAPVVFLVLFNLPHLWFRLVGLVRGYLLGPRVVEVIHRHRLPDLAVRAKEATVILLGGLCAFLAVPLLRQERIPEFWGLGALPIVFLLCWLNRKRISNLLLVTGMLASILVLGQFVLR